MSEAILPAYRRNPLTDYAHRGLNAERLNAVLTHAGESVLDAGCGNGKYVLALRNKRQTYGIDHQPFDAWQEAPELFRVADVTRLEDFDRRFDTVICFEVLEHIEDPLRLLRSFHRLAKQNIILTVPNCELTQGMRESLLCHWHWLDPTHLNYFQLDNLASLVENAGFKVQEKRLINRMDFQPLLREAYGGGLANRLLLRLLRGRPRRAYHLTCLLVASK